MSSIALYPSPGMGHLISMVELGKLILKHHPSFSINILTLIPSFNTSTTAAYVHHISTTFPAIMFHHLPDIPLDPLLYPSMEATVFELIRRSSPNVDQALKSISQSSSVSALVIDLFCTPAEIVASNLNIPVYYFFTSGACCLAQLLYFPTLHESTNLSFKEMNTLIHSPGLPPIHSSDMAGPILDRNSSDYSDFLELSNRIAKSAGIIVNTFDSLEPKVIKAISNGECVLDGPTPPIYSIGPLVAEWAGGSHECLNWLDLQPKGSVVYLCFGSLGVFSSDQLKEIALGLEMSGHRFLWVVRTPPSTNKKEDRYLKPPEPDLDLLLPNGFLDRTKDKGLVVKTWAPQVMVLSHESIGGFVTHCGWNSVLEAVRAGVPMVAWPLYAEQRFNKVVLVEEMKLALPMDELEGGRVPSSEVEKRVRQLMELEEGKAIREVATIRKEEAEIAMSDNGSSRAALSKLVAMW
ncbi:UDP-glycosyltransferase 88B1-like [Rutidosis leptorrhynchoides]|uniref:UDP-glycosyltransferase 88B1-like n=1 Tax=Rutidosis leptorrhynchoides TaxID=125765 RepID=UPI003A9A1707